MTASKEYVREKLEEYDFVHAVGDAGTVLVAEQSCINSNITTFGGFIGRTGWVPVSIDTKASTITFAPFDEVSD